MLTTGLGWGLLAIASAVTLGAAAIRGLTGFGMAIILVPLLGLIIRPDEAVVIAILLQLLIGPVGLGKIMADADKGSASLIAGSAMIATPFGVWALAHVAPDSARVVIAIIAIAAFLLVLLPPRGEKKPGLVETLATGAAAGVLTIVPGAIVIWFVRHYIAKGFAMGRV